MKVLRNLLIALSFGFMMSCSGPVDKAMDQVESVVEKIEACKTKDEAKDLKTQYKEATIGVLTALKEEVGEKATPEELEKAAEKYQKRSEELEKRYEEALKKLSK